MKIVNVCKLNVQSVSMEKSGNSPPDHQKVNPNSSSQAPDTNINNFVAMPNLFKQHHDVQFFSLSSVLFPSKLIAELELLKENAKERSEKGGYT